MYVRQRLLDVPSLHVLGWVARVDREIRDTTFDDSSRSRYGICTQHRSWRENRFGSCPGTLPELNRLNS